MLYNVVYTQVQKLEGMLRNV